jgi:hypothetical protein
MVPSSYEDLKDVKLMGLNDFASLYEYMSYAFRYEYNFHFLPSFGNIAASQTSLEYFS